MRVRYALLTILACVWLLATAAVSVATVALVSESGWSELPLFAWLLLGGLFAVALPVLLYGDYRWVIRADEAELGAS
ncbi:MAG: hypothetical protein WEB52_05665 [Dehalococcoidia bacterium]